MVGMSRAQRLAEEWVRDHDLAVYFVYGILDEQGQMVYVGVTKDAYKRLRQHKVKDLVKDHFGGNAATPLILDAGLTETEAYAREQRRYDEFQPRGNLVRPPGVPWRKAYGEELEEDTGELEEE